MNIGKGKAFICVLLVALFALSLTAGASEPARPQLPKNLRAYDKPSDAGNGIRIEWDRWEKGELSEDVVEYALFHATSPEGPWELVKTIVPTEAVFKIDDTKVLDGVKYWYILRVTNRAGQTSSSQVLGPVSCGPELFSLKRIPLGIALIAYLGVLVACITLARKGREMFIRRITGLEAIDEAIGRATEMGRPVLYVTGLGWIEDIATLASISILGQVAKKVAQYETPLIVPCYNPIVMIVEREVVKQAYLEAGKPDAYEEDRIFFLSDSQFAYAAAVDGIMLREKPAANFYMGTFYAESLILAETGASTGAIQIAGTDAVTQIPFFIAACDYTLIGEELYAASAYLSREPLQLGTLKGQDWAKVVFGLAIFIGVVLATFWPKAFLVWKELFTILD